MAVGVSCLWDRMWGTVAIWTSVMRQALAIMGITLVGWEAGHCTSELAAGCYPCGMGGGHWDVIPMGCHL